MTSPSTPFLALSSAVGAATPAVVDLPPGVPEWVRWIAILAGACATPALSILARYVAPGVVRAWRVREAKLAEQKDARAKQRRLEAEARRNDDDKGNDKTIPKLEAEARRLEDEADAHRAAVAVLEDVSGEFPVQKRDK